MIGNKLKLKGYTIATAESCTGGLVAERITQVAGASDYFIGSIVSYSNEAKMWLLNVPKEMLERSGAVSGEVERRAVRSMGEEIQDSR